MQGRIGTLRVTELVDPNAPGRRAEAHAALDRLSTTEAAVVVGETSAGAAHPGD